MARLRYGADLALIAFATVLAVTPATSWAQEDGPLTPAGPLQGTWRVVRAGDVADAAVMTLQIVHDGGRLEGGYLLLQPFCSIEQPLPVAGDEACEFIDLTGEIELGEARGRRASLSLRPGADGLPHRVLFGRYPSGGPLRGRYYGPGDRTGTPIILERTPE